MITAFALIATYVVLTGIAAYAEKPVGMHLDAFQLNAGIRTGACALGIAALLITSAALLPPLPSLLAALGIGVVQGIGSVSYCYSVDHLPVWVVASVANSYIVITVLLGLLVLHEPVGVSTVAGLILAIAGVLLISARPRSGISSATRPALASRPGRLPYIVLGANIVLVGVATFLEKPALEHGLSPLQLNAYSALGSLAVAIGALVLRRERVPVRWNEAVGAGLGTIFGLAVICYFLALNRLPVSVAAPMSNSYVILTVVLSVVLLGETLSWRRLAGMALTLAGVTLLAVAAP